MLPPEWSIKEPQRLCGTCFRLLSPYQQRWIATNSNCLRENLLEDDGTTRYFNSPLRFTLGGEVRKAAYTIQNLTDRDNVNYWERDTEYTTEMLEAVEGLLFMTVGKLAFIGGIRISTGCVIAKLPDGTWSAPCAVGSIGVTFGACLGAEVTDMVTGVDRETLDKFCTDSVSNVMLGGEASIALGPLGRTATGEAYVAGAGPSANSEAYMSYSQSRGAYGGVTVDAAYVSVRKDVNEKFYGYAVSARDVLGGKVDRPKAAEPLYTALDGFYANVFPRRTPGDRGGYGDRGPQRTYAGGTGYDDGRAVGGVDRRPGVSDRAPRAAAAAAGLDAYGRPAQPGTSRPPAPEPRGAVTARDAYGRPVYDEPPPRQRQRQPPAAVRAAPGPRDFNGRNVDGSVPPVVDAVVGAAAHGYRAAPIRAAPVVVDAAPVRAAPASAYDEQRAFLAAASRGAPQPTATVAAAPVRSPAPPPPPPPARAAAPPSDPFGHFEPKERKPKRVVAPKPGIWGDAGAVDEPPVVVAAPPPPREPAAAEAPDDPLADLAGFDPKIDDDPYGESAAI